MKKLLSLFLAAIMMLSLSVVNASAATSGNFTYSVTSGKATITGYSGSESNLVIPNSLGGYEVAVIDDSVFAGNTALVSVTIPATVTRISDYPSAYGTGAFANCKKLKTVTFKGGTNDAILGLHTFSGCSSLESVSIPGNYSVIAASAFRDCTSLKSLTYKKSDYTYANQIIDDSAFIGCTNLSSVSFSTTLKAIGSAAFENCTSITDLKIPEGVTTIEAGAFKGCTNLISLSLPSTITKIGDYPSTGFYGGAFADCKKLKTVIFEEGKSNLIIGQHTFANCNSLTTVHLPTNLEDISSTAFKTANSKLTLCSISSSAYAKVYADANGFNFKVCDNNHPEDVPVPEEPSTPSEPDTPDDSDSSSGEEPFFITILIAIWEFLVNIFMFFFGFLLG